MTISGPVVEHFKTNLRIIAWDLNFLLNNLNTAHLPLSWLYAFFVYDVILDIQICLTKLIHFHTAQVTEMPMCNTCREIRNQCFNYSSLDASRQVGDQFLISGSPQTTFGRIGEWATCNLQPWLSSFKSARVISLSWVQLLGFIHLSHVKIA